MELPNTLYAKSGDVYVAYQVFGNGSIDLVLVPGWISNLDIAWNSPASANWLRRMGRFARVVIFDKRGTGLSDRGDSAPGMDERMDDIRAVMDAAGIQRAAVLGWSEGGSLAALFAASHPDRCQALVLQNAFAKFTFLFPTEYDLNVFFEYVREKWGTGSSYAKFSPSREGDQAYRSWWARRERSGASPSTAIALMRLASEIDVSGILPSVQVPTLVVHRSEDCVVDIEGGRQLAKLIPNAKFFEIPGVDHTPWTGEYLDEIADKIEEFLTGFKPTAILDRVLATVLFTDIVGSTELVETHGDRRWRQLLNEHDEIVRRELKRFRGREVKSLGDGFLATFDGPARAAPAPFQASRLNPRPRPPPRVSPQPIFPAPFPLPEGPRR